MGWLGPAAPFIPFALAAFYALRGPADSRPRPAPLRAGLLDALGIGAFALPLVHYWSQGKTVYSAIGGYLPWSDAGGYVSGAYSLLIDGELDAWNSRRPLNAALLAVRLAVTGMDLRGALVLQALLLGLAAVLASRAIARSLGPAAGMAFFAGVYAFGYVMVPLTLSEALGLTLGTVGFWLVWEGQSRRPLHTGAGFFFLAAGLGARAGAYLVLPALMAWLVWTRRDRVRAAFTSTTAAIAGTVTGLAVGAVIAGAYGPGEGNLQGNFAHTLYGLAVGGAGWTQVYEDYPEIGLIEEEAEQNAFIYDRAIERVRADPRGLVVGLARGVAKYVAAAPYLMTFPSVPGPVRVLLAGVIVLLGGAVLVVSFLRWRRRSLARWAASTTLAGLVVIGLPYTVPDSALWLRSHQGVRALVPLFCVCALVIAWRGASDPAGGLFVAASVGAFISAPFIIPDGGLRVLAATIPFFAYGLALVAWAAARSSMRPLDAEGAKGVFGPVTALAVALASAVAVPVVAGSRHELQPPADAAASPAMCRRDEQRFHAVTTAGLRIVPDTSPAWAPDVRHDDFLRAAPGFDGIEVAGLLATLDAGTAVVQVRSGVGVSEFVLATERFPVQGGQAFLGCTVPEIHPQLGGYEVRRIVSWSPGRTSR